jgi:hypothetical protein
MWRNAIESPRSTVIAGVPSAVVGITGLSEVHADPTNWVGWVKLAISIVFMVLGALQQDGGRK